ncbi:hypothetical protein COCNU_04G011270 [Cocos nucifera]|uniref:Uncharacterized protein n=1 Tax=Cocos nucifera TaxID=13894 RepID=A0A8K0I6J1_COCNU|nr:hypothetical protein COCNU_04G011260 [Cocos nucifera]KAG1338821.1 hypothetical protein COCNU_04G011270 [Cocos nucifera]
MIHSPPKRLGVRSLAISHPTKSFYRKHHPSWPALAVEAGAASHRLGTGIIRGLRWYRRYHRHPGKVWFGAMKGPKGPWLRGGFLLLRRHHPGQTSGDPPSRTGRTSGIHRRRPTFNNRQARIRLKNRIGFAKKAEQRWARKSSSGKKKVMLPPVLLEAVAAVREV